MVDSGGMKEILDERSVAARLQGEVREVARLLSEAGSALVRIAQLLQEGISSASTTPPAPRPTEPQASAQAVTVAPRCLSTADRPRRPWEEILTVAVRLLDAEPERVWRPGELSRAIKASGEVELGKIQGMHLGLIRRLLTRGEIEAQAGGYRRTHPVAPEPTPVPVPERTLPPALKRRVASPPDWDEVDVLDEEIESGREHLSNLGVEKRTAQICVWAGRARLLQQLWMEREDPVARKRLRALDHVFGKLTRITRDLECDWIDALSRDWSTDWDTYIAYNQVRVSGGASDLPAEKEQEYQRSILRGLFNPRRYLQAEEAQTAIAIALEVLAQDDPMVVAAIERFGRRRPAERTQRPGRESAHDRAEMESLPSRWQVPADVLSLTQGMRVLIVGGQGSREEQRLSIQSAFKFAELEWVFSERGQASPFNRLVERIRPGRYDLVLFLAGFSSHHTESLVRACKESDLPIVYLPRGYGVNTIASAIDEQLVRHRTVPV
jgi:hypothetical protein